MLKNLLFIALLACTGSANAQWTRLTTNATNNPDLEPTDIGVAGEHIMVTGFLFSDFSGQILESYDDGQSWSLKQMETGKLLKTIAFKDDDNGFIGGYGSVSVLYKTTDGGQNWTNVFTDFNNAGINDIQFVNNDVIVASGYAHTQFFSGQCYRSYDGGNNWDTIRHQNLGCLDTLPMDFVQFVDAKNGYGRADFLLERSIMKTTDSGNTWTLVYTHPAGISGMHFWNVNNGIIVDNDGKVMRTTDGGQNWTQQANGLATGGKLMFKIRFLNQTTGFAVGEGGFIFRTTDGGNTWTQDPKITGATYTALRFAKNRAYAAGRNGVVVRSEVLPNNVNDVLPLAEQLNIYPNPATDMLHISAYQNAYKHIKAALVDVTGKTVAQAAATNTILNIDVSALPAGNYILQLEADGKAANTQVLVGR